MTQKKNYIYSGDKEGLLEGLKGKSIVGLEHKYGGTLVMLNTSEVVLIGSTGVVLFPSMEVMEEKRAEYERVQATKIEGVTINGSSLPNEMVEGIMAKAGIDVAKLKSAKSAEEIEAILDAAGAEYEKIEEPVVTTNREEEDTISWPKLDVNEA